MKKYTLLLTGNRQQIHKIMLLVIFGMILYSCNSANNQTTGHSQTEHINPLYDPTIFIGKHKAKAMVLGVFHFSNPGLDGYKPKYTVDILSKKRQKEIADLLEKLATYKPTKILIEGNRKLHDSIYNAMYQDYLKGTFDMSNRTNEHFQLGFKLAKKLGHNRIYASDVKNSNWFGADIDWDTYDEEKYLKSLGQFHKITRYNYEDISKHDDSLKLVQSLTEHFKVLNNPKHLLKSHQQYLTNVVIEGAGDLYIGGDNLARWYQRNIKIFANTYDIADFDKEERILMIYGAGHVWQLRQLLTDSPDFDYIEVNDYLMK